MRLGAAEGRSYRLSFQEAEPDPRGIDSSGGVLTTYGELLSSTVRTPPSYVDVQDPTHWLSPGSRSRPTTCRTELHQQIDHNRAVGLTVLHGFGISGAEISFKPRAVEVIMGSDASPSLTVYYNAYERRKPPSPCNLSNNPLES